MNIDINERLTSIETQISKLARVIKDSLKLHERQAKEDVVDYIYDVIPDIEDLDDYEIILETMNQVGNAAGFSFKKGQSYQKTTKTIIRKFYDRNKDKSLTKNQSGQKHNHPPMSLDKADLTSQM